MDARTRRKFAGAHAQASPERSRLRPEPPPAQQQMKLYPGKKIPVVYYLCRNRHLEHPHFIEVPISSSEGLFLRDVISRLNVLRGKGMAAMYSWSCKRSYKTGFVWHDLSEDDLILPAHGNEYVLKGSELLDQSPSGDRTHNGTSNAKIQSFKHAQQEASPSLRTQEASCSSSPPAVVLKEAKPHPPPPSPSRHSSQEDDLSPTLHRPGSAGTVSPDVGGARRTPRWETGSRSPVEYPVCKINCAQDAATQTDDQGGRMACRKETCMRGVSTDDGSVDHDSDRILKLKQNYEIEREEVSPPPDSSSSSGGKTETLESLIRAEAKLSRFTFLEEDQALVSTRTRLKASNVLMHLITCGSISVKDHHNVGVTHSYTPRLSHMKFRPPMISSSMMLGELDCLSDNPRMIGLKMEDKEYFSGSLIEAKKRMVEAGEGVPTLKRSSSYNADRRCKSPGSKQEKETAVELTQSKCLPKSIKITSNKHSRNETMKSPVSNAPRMSSAVLESSKGSPLCSSKGGSRRLTDTSSLQGSSMRLESFKEEKEKVIKIEENLLLELGL